SAPRMQLSKPEFSAYAIGFRDFDEERVGKKSYNQLLLRGKLPKWVQQPKSVALPFGVFEKVLAQEQNNAVAERCEALIKQLTRTSGAGVPPARVGTTEGGGTPAPLSLSPVPALLSELRQHLLQLSAPDDLIASLRPVTEEAGLAWPTNWEEAWMRIKQVWASKWNERAYWSRQAAGIAHEDLCMAVL